MVDGDTLGIVAMGYVVYILGSFKNRGLLWFYCRRGIGEDGIDLKFCFACDGIRWWYQRFFVDFFNAAFKPLAVDIIVSVGLIYYPERAFGDHEPRYSGRS